jgi:Flp pilus assembly protein TadG
MNFRRRFLRCTKGAAALEAAIVLPVFLTLTVGMVDVGAGMFIAMEVNNAAQAGAASAVSNSGSLTGVAAAMTAAAGGLTITATPAPTLTGGILTVTASYNCTQANRCSIMPWSIYPKTMTSTVTVRLQ